MNEFKLFGKALEKPELIVSEKGNKYCNVYMGVEKPYKNQEGETDVDSFKITCFKTLAEDLCEKLKKGKKIIIKGRIQQNNFDKDKEEKFYRPELVGERVWYTD